MMSNPLCPFCGEPWSEDAIKILDYTCRSCDSGGIYQNEVKIGIVCHKCERTMYEKEFDLGD
jgi:uncharacterized protein (DUF983 family)